VLGAFPLSASLPDATGARQLLPEGALFFLHAVLGDRAYRSAALAAALATLGPRVDATSPALPAGTDFVPLPLRWKVEQYFSWLMRQFLQVPVSG
jgi:hypothetical protein